MVLGTPDATPKVPQFTCITRGEHPASQHHFISALSPLVIVTGESIPLFFLEGVGDLPGKPQDEASLTRKFVT